MKIAANIVKYHSKGQVGIEEIKIEDVSSFEFTENSIIIKFNNSPDQIIELRSNDGSHTQDWRGVNLFITREFLQVDMSK